MFKVRASIIDQTKPTQVEVRTALEPLTPFHGVVACSRAAAVRLQWLPANSRFTR
jgi:hypothetical protein